MKKIVIALGIVYLGCVLAAFDWKLSLFLLPFAVGIVWVVYSAVIYHSQMEELVEQVADEQEFIIVEKDELDYIVVKPRSS
jgi:hypothetical protein